ncbi:hypothetical protein ES708_07640 [subsurface metagenome]
MPRPRLADQHEYMTTTDVCKKLGISMHQLRTRLAQGIFPEPSKIERGAARLFDEGWLRAARKIVKAWKKKRE